MPLPLPLLKSLKLTVFTWEQSSVMNDDYIQLLTLIPSKCMNLETFVLDFQVLHPKSSVFLNNNGVIFKDITPAVLSLSFNPSNATLHCLVPFTIPFSEVMKKASDFELIIPQCSPYVLELFILHFQTVRLNLNLQCTPITNCLQIANLLFILRKFQNLKELSLDLTKTLLKDGSARELVSFMMTYSKCKLCLEETTITDLG